MNAGSYTCSRVHIYSHVRWMCIRIFITSPATTAAVVVVVAARAIIAWHLVRNEGARVHAPARSPRQSSLNLCQWWRVDGGDGDGSGGGGVPVPADAAILNLFRAHVRARLCRPPARPPTYTNTGTALCIILSSERRACVSLGLGCA